MVGHCEPRTQDIVACHVGSHQHQVASFNISYLKNDTLYTSISSIPPCKTGGKSLVNQTLPAGQSEMSPQKIYINSAQFMKKTLHILKF